MVQHPRTPGNTINPGGTASHTPARSRTAAFFDWILGADPAVDQEAVADRLREPEVVVAAPAERNSWVDSFHVALTDAATTFILQHVDPYHREDSTAGYSIRRVKVGFHQAAAPCLRAIQSLPPAMRDRIVLLRIKKAKGSEQLMLDQFYGMSILAEETLMDGQLVETIVSYSGCRFCLHFEFEGEYVTLPSTIPVEPSLDAITPYGSLNRAETSTIAIEASSVASSSAPHTRGPVKPSATMRLGGQDTPLHRPTSVTNSGRDTPLNRPFAKPTRKPLARLRLKASSEEVVVDLFEDDFPYTVGRHPEVPGFAVRPRNALASGVGLTRLLASTQGPDSLCYVSRDHLTLHMPDFTSGEVMVDNLSAQRGKNGTYVNGIAKPLRFIHSVGSQHPLCLGGSNGDGTLVLNMEPA